MLYTLAATLAREEKRSADGRREDDDTYGDALLDGKQLETRPRGTLARRRVKRHDSRMTHEG